MDENKVSNVIRESRKDLEDFYKIRSGYRPIYKKIGNRIFNQILNLNKSDVDFYNSARKLFHDEIKNKNISYEDIDKNEEKYNIDRAKKHISTLKLLKIEINPTTRIIDFGCGKGYLIDSIIELYLIPKRNALCIDVNDKDEKEYTYIKINPEDSLLDLTVSNRELRQNSFDVVFCGVVLHHVLDLYSTLRGLFLLLKPNGYLVIREHDAIDKKIKDLLDVVHGFHSVVFPEQMETNAEDFVKEKIQYFSKEEWDRIITSIGFIKKNNTKPRGTLRQYYSVYQKPSNRIRRTTKTKIVKRRTRKQYTRYSKKWRFE